MLVDVLLLSPDDREIVAASTRSNERRQALGPSVNFREETTCGAGSTASRHLARKATMKIRASECFLSIGSGDLRNEGQKTQAERLKLQAENCNHKPRTKVISRYLRRSSMGAPTMGSTLLTSSVSL